MPCAVSAMKNRHTSNATSAPSQDSRRSQRSSKGTKSRASTVRTALDAPSAPTIRSAQPSSDTGRAWGPDPAHRPPRRGRRSWRIDSNRRRPMARRARRTPRLVEAAAVRLDVNGCSSARITPRSPSTCLGRRARTPSASRPRDHAEPEGIVRRAPLEEHRDLAVRAGSCASGSRSRARPAPRRRPRSASGSPRVRGRLWCSYSRARPLTTLCMSASKARTPAPAFGGRSSAHSALSSS